MAGGTQNFVAVKEALSVTDAAMPYTLLMGALCYSVWLVVIMTLIGSMIGSFVGLSLAEVLVWLADVGRF